MPGIKNPYIKLHDLESLCHGNEILEACLEDMVNYSMRYAETVCRFEQIVATSEGQNFSEDGIREEIELVRSTIHDSTIDAINVLSRNLKNSGKDNGWLKPILSQDRPAYGKFAILIAFEAIANNQTTEEVSYV